MFLIEFEDYYLNPTKIDYISPVSTKIDVSSFVIKMDKEFIVKNFDDEDVARAFRKVIILKINNSLDVD